MKSGAATVQLLRENAVDALRHLVRTPRPSERARLAAQIALRAYDAAKADSRAPFRSTRCQGVKP